MVKAPTNKGKGRDDGGGSSKGGGGFIVLILLTLIGAGLGVGYKLYFMEAPKQPQATQAAEQKSERAEGHEGAGHDEHSAKESEAAVTNGTTVVRLQPIVTDLPGEPKRWLRLEVSLVFSGKPEEGIDVISQLSNADFLAFLRTVSLAQIEGPDGLDYLTDDLEELARIRSKGAVSKLLINSMVTE